MEFKKRKQLSNYSETSRESRGAGELFFSNYLFAPILFGCFFIGEIIIRVKDQCSYYSENEKCNTSRGCGCVEVFF